MEGHRKLKFQTGQNFLEENRAKKLSDLKLLLHSEISQQQILVI